MAQYSEFLSKNSYGRRYPQDSLLHRTLTGASEEAHLAYLDALRTLPLVNIINGKYQTQHIDCRVKDCTYSGKRQFFRYQEKRTDVNIALQMLDDAHRDKCERQILVSGDSDLVPAVRMVRGINDIKVIVYVPVIDETRFVAQELRKSANMSRNLPLANLKNFQFGDEIAKGDGVTIKKDLRW